MTTDSFRRLSNSHDLNLPLWGPYTKKYMGISHLSNEQQGIRFDLSIIPSFYRRKIEMPNVKWEKNFHPWYASADLNNYTIRYELEWRDKVYCDVSFSKITDDLRLIKCEYVNSTDNEQNLALHYMASLNYPTYPNSNEVIKPYEVIMPEQGVWIDALDYKALKFAIPRHDDHMVNDALLKGEERKDGFILGRCLGNGFGVDTGDCVSYKLSLDNTFEKPVALIRYYMSKDDLVTLKINENDAILLKGNGTFETLKVNLRVNDDSLTISSQGNSEILLDGLAIVDDKDFEEVKFKPCSFNYKPIMKQEENKLIFKYEDSQHYYGVKWLHEHATIREFCTNQLDTLMSFKVHNHVDQMFYENDLGHYTDILMQPIFLKPHESKVFYGLVGNGSSEDEIKELLNLSFDDTLKTSKQDMILEEGKQYLFSQEKMKATMLTNVVYPAYLKGEYIRHNTPGRWWDSLYTWDSGFIGIGFCDIDIHRAIDCLNAYVSEEDDDQRAFIHHGTPLPVQIYLLQEIFNKTQCLDTLAFFYKRIKSAYDFLLGENGHSNTNKFTSGLLQTWSYFYNSGGWDDYPPQHYLHGCDDKNLVNKTTPVITTANLIRCGKTLKQLALLIDEAEDAKAYDLHIAKLTNALQTYAWDEEAGYFSYVVHDDAGRAKKQLKLNDENYNKGLDGVFPLIADVCTEDQKTRLLNHLKSPERLWTPIGISTVDQSAGYYSKAGYWNGAVWMPHQWFVWKTMLDLGESDFAWQIADTALNLWKSEVEKSYNCFEHFIIETGRGAGWHQFGGLSSPVINWFAAYYKAGTITVGFDTLVLEQEFSEAFDGLKTKIKSSKDSTSVLITMNPAFSYKVLCDGKEIPFKSRNKGHIEVHVTFTISEHELVIIKN